jgi:integrase
VATIRLTQRVVDTLTTDRKQEDVWDAGFRTRGVTFGVRVTRFGAKEYICRYRDKCSRRRVSLGDATRMSLRIAYDKARQIAAQIDFGVALATEAQRAVTSTATIAIAGFGHGMASAANGIGSNLPSSAQAAISFSDLCREYLSEHAALKKDGGRKDAQIIRRELLPAWSEKLAQEVQRQDVIKLLKQIAHERQAPVMANRTRSLVSRIFNFGIEVELVKSSPCTGLPKRKREEAKERVLDAEEIRTLWRLLEAEPPFVAGMFKMILLTGQRPGEVVGACWSEIEGGVWTIPKERIKNGRTHRIPISPAVHDLLGRMREHPERPMRELPANYVFPSARYGYLSSCVLRNATQRLNASGALASFSAHDLRRTCATGLRRLGVGREVVGRILNHTPQSVTMVYDRYDQMAEMKDALDKWGEQLVTVTSIREAICREGAA